eukprot:CAMPEP_0185840824 /NCGR_PEP_ID=MMETSP1353-20130828/16856_1 /TAXON_ID=1077150 /ORGANISM="Erythrolobus australicus, Strain CCMP3124" /LENGTH=85 /DNA_ID=CAMNT_0028540203 /DNA_START=97 /DNA_END=354 /DNA_ORIENTATION=+
MSGAGRGDRERAAHGQTQLIPLDPAGSTSGKIFCDRGRIRLICKLQLSDACRPKVCESDKHLTRGTILHSRSNALNDVSTSTLHE